MIYYCKNCGGVFVAGDKKPMQGVGTRCPQCDERMIIIHDYETPAQHESRTGTPYPDNGAVWVRHKTEGSGYAREFWELSAYGELKNDDCRDLGCLVVIASPPVPPPDDFVPEET